jgi:phytoene synthase
VSVQEAYAEAVRITRREARNFAWGIALLPRAKRDAISALYAFARRVDDIADDGALPVERRRAALEECLAEVEALPSAPPGDPVLVALADAVRRYSIRRETVRDLVRGGLMDAERSRYGSWDELAEYCRCVAGSVGIACAAVYEPRDRAAAMPRAETLGLALQQINIMRDVPEDWRLGRVYLPQQELARFGVVEADIAAGRTGPEWRALMEHQAERADRLLADGLRLLPLLDRRSRLGVRTFAGIYRGLLMQMRAKGYDVFSERPHLSAVGKLRAVGALRVPKAAA